VYADLPLASLGGLRLILPPDDAEEDSKWTLSGAEF